ncbi:hypothetical protein LOK49_LG10G00911 [Camellia lanceoleosa]|uniref:Uncharacterized protein n=1 Tax=Camellia lanceoleosa TaxID=1840588 RepID=A0ACC0GCM1_9ERIC|nr:hypothetical protein LOK49_LG10G00911 [Camellia lanceoleosa]
MNTETSSNADYAWEEGCNALSVNSTSGLIFPQSDAGLLVALLYAAVSDLHMGSSVCACLWVMLVGSAAISSAIRGVAFSSAIRGVAFSSAIRGADASSAISSVSFAVSSAISSAVRC